MEVNIGWSQDHPYVAHSKVFVSSESDIKGMEASDGDGYEPGNATLRKSSSQTEKEKKAAEKKDSKETEAKKDEKKADEKKADEKKADEKKTETPTTEKKSEKVEGEAVINKNGDKVGEFSGTKNPDGTMKGTMTMANGDTRSYLDSDPPVYRKNSNGKIYDQKTGKEVIPPESAIPQNRGGASRQYLTAAPGTTVNISDLPPEARQKYEAYASGQIDTWDLDKDYWAQYNIDVTADGIVIE
jgi:hypothetical protein